MPKESQLKFTKKEWFCLHFLVRIISFRGYLQYVHRIRFRISEMRKKNMESLTFYYLTCEPELLSHWFGPYSEMVPKKQMNEAQSKQKNEARVDFQQNQNTNYDWQSMRSPLHSYNVQMLVCNFEFQIHIQTLYAGTARWIARIIGANSRNYLYIMKLNRPRALQLSPFNGNWLTIQLECLQHTQESDMVITINTSSKYNAAPQTEFIICAYFVWFVANFCFETGLNSWRS